MESSLKIELDMNAYTETMGSTLFSNKSDGPFYYQSVYTLDWEATSLVNQNKVTNSTKEHG